MCSSQCVVRVHRELRRYSAKFPDIFNSRNGTVLQDTHSRTGGGVPIRNQIRECKHGKLSLLNVFYIFEQPLGDRVEIQIYGFLNIFVMCVTRAETGNVTKRFEFQ